MPQNPAWCVRAPPMHNTPLGEGTQTSISEAK